MPPVSLLPQASSQTAAIARILAECCESRLLHCFNCLAAIASCNHYNVCCPECKVYGIVNLFVWLRFYSQRVSDVL